MNPQTLTTRANSEHFGHNENVKSAPPRVAGKTKKSAGAAKLDAAPPVHAEHQPSAPLETTFKFDAPHAHDVLLAGCFTQWEKSPVKMLKGGGGVWHAKVTLKPGSYQYRFIVDGQWQNDPHSHNQVGNPYGSQNSVLEIR